MTNKNITHSEVAKAAGVSAMTVSLVMNQKNVARSETREQILKIADNLGYRPNRLPRSLESKRSTTIGLVVPDIFNPFFSKIACGIEDQVYALDYNVFLFNSDEVISRELVAFVSLAEKQPDTFFPRELETALPLKHCHTIISISHDWYPIGGNQHVWSSSSTCTKRYTAYL